MKTIMVFMLSLLFQNNNFNSKDIENLIYLDSQTKINLNSHLKTLDQFSSSNNLDELSCIIILIDSNISLLENIKQEAEFLSKQIKLFATSKMKANNISRDEYLSLISKANELEKISKFSLKNAKEKLDQVVERFDKLIKMKSRNLA